MAERLNRRLLEEGCRTEELPVTYLVLTSAFGNKSSRIKVQALITFQLGEESFDHVFFISSQLTSQILLGADFLYHHKFSIDFEEECLIRCDPEDEGKVYRYPFIRDIGNVAEENHDMDPCKEGDLCFVFFKLTTAAMLVRSQRGC
jgi:hypothetical protein